MPRRGGRPSRQYLEDTKRMQEKRKLREVGMLTGGQAKIAAKAPPPNKIDEKDLIDTLKDLNFTSKSSLAA